MLRSFIGYFVSYIFRNKTRQRLLILAMVGVVISSLALLVIQSVMGGLQKGLIKRSKMVHGSAEILFSDLTEHDSKEKLWQQLRDNNIFSSKEYQLELLLKHEIYFSPAIIHGIETNAELPDFLANKDLSGLVVGADLGSKLKSNFVSQIEIISPAHTDSLFGEIPGQVIENVSDFLLVDLAEVDMFHVWTRMSLVQNLVRERTYNKIRVFDRSPDILKKLDQLVTDPTMKIRSWEYKNKSLVYALNLETTMMMLLFSMMALLVGVTIASGFNIFFSKVRVDLMSFWILGCAEQRLYKMFGVFVTFMGGFSTVIGLTLGLGLLMLLKLYSPQIMPDVFIERSLPVHLSWQGLASSFFIPLLISVVSSLYSLMQMKREGASFINLIRKVG